MTSSDPAGRKLKCRLCSAESEWKEGFVAQGTVVHGPHHLCTTCFHFREKYRNLYWPWLGWASGALVFGFSVTGTIGGAVFFAAGVYGVLYLSMVLHELGHFFAAAALGVRVSLMSFGGGLWGKIFKIRETFIILSPHPSEGMIIPDHTEVTGYRWKQMLITAAGPVVNIMSALIGMYLLIRSGRVEFGWYAVLALALWTSLNTWFAIINLLPLNLETTTGKYSSDGAQLGFLRKVTDEQVEEILKAGNVLLAYLECEFGDLDAARSIVEKYLDDGKISSAAQNVVTNVLAEKGEYVRCVELCRRWLQDETAGPLERATLQNNLAYLLACAGDPSHLDEADRLSASAMEALPMLLPIRSTRADVLIARGRYQEAIDLLDDKRFRLERRRHRANVACLLAQAQARLGRLDDAAKSLRTAAALHPASPRLDAARNAVGAMQRA